jgi:chemosensory pili system protein ChpA (sensor histidine kinase/response regulator)
MQYTVLVADDNDDLRGEVAWLLRAEGYRVLTAADGIDALERLYAGHIDALVLDWNMPRLGGSGVLAAVSRDARLADLAVIVATADPERVSTERPMPILAKPFSLAGLVDVLRATLETARGRADRSGGAPSARLMAVR